MEISRGKLLLSFAEAAAAAAELASEAAEMAASAAEMAAEVEAAATSDCCEKSVFFVACNKELKRYCYEIEDNKKDNINTTKRKRKRCCCFSSSHQEQQQHRHELFKQRVLEPLANSCGYRTNKSGKYVAVGSIIYCIGGYHRRRSLTEVALVLSFDTTHPKSGWKMGTPMIRSRGCPQALAIEGKLYVLGGCLVGRKPWGEVFDPSTDKWEALPEPPIPLEETFSAVVNEQDRKMVVLGSGSGELYGYNWLTNTWSFLFNEISLGVSSSRVVEPAVVFDMTLYWYVGRDGKHKLEAYDLENRMWFTGIIEGLEWDGLVTPPIDPSIFDYDLDVVSPKLFHLGSDGQQRNLWFLIWEDYRAYKDYSSNKRKSNYYKCIDSIKFEVTKRINSRGYGVLDIQIQSSQIHLIHPSLCFEDAFLI